MARILLVDDNIDYLRTTEEFLHDELDEDSVVTASSEKDASIKLRELMPDLVVTDMKMGWDWTGLELTGQIKRHSPRSMVIILTAYPSIKDAVTCIRAGCFDYLDKEDGWQELLRSIVRAKELCGSDRDSLDERLILAHWDILKKADSSAKKGTALEGLCASILQTIPGWRKIESRVRSSLEEIDLVVENESDDRTWSTYGKYILVECKNWSQDREKPGAGDCVTFYSKIQDRGIKHCQLGFFVSLNGVTRTFNPQRTRRSDKNIVIVVIDEDNLWEITRSDDRSEVLKRLVKRSFSDH